ncbi:hypothetical protein [Lactococcus petauri]|uniref:hypothetical protein n=1 Tax=Lactococcus petauri TaxID=1940789 RepID=UPI00254BA767|nr:hypothetical protein [Lactococcus petauri]
MKKYRIMKRTFNNGDVLYNVDKKVYKRFLGLKIPFYSWVSMKLFREGMYDWVGYTDSYDKAKEEFDKQVGETLKKKEVVK